MADSDSDFANLDNVGDEVPLPHDADGKTRPKLRPRQSRSKLEHHLGMSWAREGKAKKLEEKRNQTQLNAMKVVVTASRSRKLKKQWDRMSSSVPDNVKKKTQSYREVCESCRQRFSSS